MTVYWASLLSIITQNSLVQAGNAIQLKFEWRAPPPSLVQDETLRRLKSRSHIQAGMYNNVSVTAYGAYMANVTIGTPGQSLMLVIETGSAETIVLAASAYECNQHSWANGDGPCYGGTCRFTSKTLPRRFLLILDRRPREVLNISRQSTKWPLSTARGRKPER
jgi:Eukaryotic aspartyl protease